MWHGKKHRVCQVHTAGLLIDGDWKDVRVHCDGAVPTQEVCAQFNSRIFGAQEWSQTPVNDEYHLCQPVPAVLLDGVGWELDGAEGPLEAEMEGEVLDLSFRAEHSDF